MFNTIFWRLVWKEYRQQRALMLVMVAVLGMTAMFKPAAGDRELSAVFVGFLFVLPFVYALGCGGMLFSAERENETIAWLRSLPHLGRNVFWAKMSVAICSTLLFILASYLLAGGANVSTKYSYQASNIPPFIVLVEMVIELLLWTAFCSMTVRTVIGSVIAAGVAATVAASFYALLAPLLNAGSEFEIVIAAGMRCIGIGVVLSLCLRYRDNWWSDEPMRKEASASQLRSSWQLPSSMGEIRWGSTFRLLWQEIRESWLMLAGIYFIYLLGLRCLPQFGPIKLNAYLMLLIPAVFGACAFSADHRNHRFRFFTEQGIPARTVWAGRVLFWFLASLPSWLISASMTADRTNGHDGRVFLKISNESINHNAYMALAQLPDDFIITYPLLFSLGVCLSLYIPHSYFTICLSVVFGAFSLAVISLLRFGGIPDWLAFVPLVAGLLLISWLRAPDWLTERNSWKNYLKPVMYILPFGVIYLTSLAYHRAYEIPYVPSPLPELPVTSTQIENQDIYSIYAKAYPEMLSQATPAQLDATEEFESIQRDMLEYLNPSIIKSIRNDRSNIYVDDGSGGRKLVPAYPMTAQDNSKVEATVKRLIDLFELPDVMVRGQPSPRVNFLLAPPSSIEKTIGGTKHSNHELNGLMQGMIYFTEVSNRPRTPEQLKDTLRKWYVDMKLEFAFSMTSISTYGSPARFRYSQEQMQEHLISWANDAGQTSELIQFAKENLPPNKIDWRTWDLRRHLEQRQAIRLNPESLHRLPVSWVNDPATTQLVKLFNFGNTGSYYDRVGLFLSFQPWERERSNRLNNQIYHSQGALNVQDRRKVLEQWWNSTWLVHLSILSPAWQTKMDNEIEYQHVLTKLRLSLIGYRLEHGKFPEKLEDLGSDALYPLHRRRKLDALNNPDDVAGIVGESDWCYRPQGMPIPVPVKPDIISLYARTYNRYKSPYYTIDAPGLSEHYLPPGTPFIWFPVYARQISVVTESDPQTGKPLQQEKKWFSTVGKDNKELIEDENQLMQHGYAYPLGPAPNQSPTTVDE